MTQIPTSPKTSESRFLSLRLLPLGLLALVVLLAWPASVGAVECSDYAGPRDQCSFVCQSTCSSGMHCQVFQGFVPGVGPCFEVITCEEYCASSAYRSGADSDREDARGPVTEEAFLEALRAEIALPAES